MGEEEIHLLKRASLPGMQKSSPKGPTSISGSVTLNLTPPEVSSEACTFFIDASRFQPKPEKKVSGVTDYVIVGFDTEYVTPESPSSRDDIREGRAKYRVLSYQFHCLLPSGEAWSGITVPAEGERISMGELIVFALGSRPENPEASLLPRSIYLVGHYTKADLPAFSDFDSIKKVAAAVRSSFVSTDASFDFAVNTSGGDIGLCVLLRDTFLLAPAGSQSLASLGEILGIPKVLLHADPAKEREIKSRMDDLRSRDWPLFRRYAIQDAVICAEYAERIIRLCEQHLGKPRLPVTLTAIGVDLLLKKWCAETRDEAAILGREVVKEKRWNKRRGHYQVKKREVPQLNYSLYETLATECYHGGRNEQYWFGPAFADEWTDYDLSSAYATGMALIGTPDWTTLRHTLAVEDFGIQTLGYALVEFKFPDTVRFPSLPIRTDNGLVFPKAGQSFCAAPEIALAHSLGAKLTIKHGVVIATNNSELVFASYIKHCITERRKHPKKSLDDLFWKELSNSTYGKTAQGLREKRVYDSREMDMVPLPPSKITNPYFAAYITSFVRAVIGELLNALPHRVCVFSCTTDGFLTNATNSEIDAAVQGPIAKAFRETRGLLTGEPTVLEIKHQVRCPLGWRTRGQATLIEGSIDHPMNIVLAKGGLRLDDKFDTQDLRNAEIVRMFFDRKPDDKLTFETLTGIRDIVEFDSDLVPKEVSRRVNMEFDWKRKPELLFDSMDYGHVAFCTVPWDSVEQFQAMREFFDQYQDRTPVCIKSVGDFDSFSYYVETKSRLAPEYRAYVRTTKGDIKRLRQMLCVAWHSSACGVREFNEITVASQFAAALTECGIPCKVDDVQNGKKKVFAAHSVPLTDRTIAAAAKLKAKIPTFVPNSLWSEYEGGVSTLPERRPYGSADEIEGAPEGSRWLLEFARRQTDTTIKGHFEMPRDVLRRNIPYWMR